MSVMLLQMEHRAQCRLHLAHGIRERLGVLVARSQDVKRQALRAFRADARQFAQLFDEPRHGFRKSSTKSVPLRCFNRYTPALPRPGWLSLEEDVMSFRALDLDAALGKRSLNCPPVVIEVW